MSISTFIRLVRHSPKGGIIDTDEYPIKVEAVPRAGDFIEEYGKEYLVTKVVWNVLTSHNADSSTTYVDIHLKG